ncbi:hypothetical protein RYA05_05560 [Pseudomonas syringae pv. actinidiae]|nr:hypothetical protein [Pseudomonas syringae pv. actinidiae]
MNKEISLEIDVSQGIEYLFDQLVQQCMESDSSLNLSAGLPGLFTDSKTLKKSWSQILGGDKNIGLQLKDIMSSIRLPSMVAKQVQSHSPAHQAEMLSKLLATPHLRCYKPDSQPESKRTISELMMSRLLQFPEYADASLDNVRDLLEGSLLCDRQGLFGGSMTSVAEMCSSIFYSTSDVARLIRLSKLHSYISRIDELPIKEKVDLVAGIFGLFDANGLSTLFCLFLDDYPQVRPYFEGNSYVRRADRTKEQGTYADYLIDLMIRDITDDDQFETDAIVHHLRVMGGFPLFLKWHQESSRIRYLGVTSELSKGVSAAQAHIKSLVHFNEGFAIDGLGDFNRENIDGLDGYILTNLFMESAFLLTRMRRIMDHPFIRSLMNKDDEKAALVEELKVLDHTKFEDASRLADKIRALCQSADDAPEDLTQKIEGLSNDMVKYRDVILAPLRTPVLAIEAPADVVGERSEPNLVPGGELQAALEHAHLLEVDKQGLKERLDILEQKLSEQRTLNAELKRSARHVSHGDYRPPSEEGEVINKLAKYVTENGVKNPEDMLNFLSMSYPDRVVVLDSAMQSAKGSSSFKQVTKLGILLNLLITDYLDAILGGQPDAVARHILGDALRARESDSVLGNARLRAMRQFVYNSEKRVFHKHLAIGVKPGVAFSIRIYYEILDSKVIIGWCGEHLETMSSQ